MRLEKKRHRFCCCYVYGEKKYIEGECNPICIAES